MTRKIAKIVSPLSPFCYIAIGYRRVARYYESAIDRFTSVDPLAEKYYSWSPYAYVANNPLKYIDPDGRRLVNTLSPNVYKVLGYVAKIAATYYGNIVLSTLINSNEKYSLSETMIPRTANYSSLGRIITYPNITMESLGSSIEGGSNRKEYWIGHESFHAFDHDKGTFNRQNQNAKKDIIESRAVSFENYLRDVYSDFPYRTSYGSIKGDFFQFSGSEEKISNFKILGDNAPTKKHDGIYKIGASYTYENDKNTINKYIIVSQSLKGDISYKFYENEDEYKKATERW